MVAARILVALVGCMFVYSGMLLARAWRQGAAETRSVRAGVGALTASRLGAGIAFLVGGVMALWPAIVAGAVGLLLGNIAASAARRHLKRQT